MAKSISVSRAASCAEYFSLSKCTKVVNVSMEKEGKVSANVHLKTALGVVCKTTFDLSCVCTSDKGLYMGYRDYADTLAVKDGKEVVYTEEVRVNKNGEEYIVHVVDFDEEEDCVGYYEGAEFKANDVQWDGRTWKAPKVIDGLIRCTPKDVVKAFFAKFDLAIRTHNAAIDVERAAKKAAKKDKVAKKEASMQKAYEDGIAQLKSIGITMTAEQMMAYAAMMGVNAKIA